MSTMTTVRGFEVHLELAYAAGSHMWVEELDGPAARLGLDALGVQTSGSLAHVDLVPVGTEVVAGDPIGTVEADKFVGPLLSPLAGVVSQRNDAVMAEPGLVQHTPYGAGWLVVMDSPVAGWGDELSQLVRGPDLVQRWFEDEIRRLRREGVLAW